MSDQPVPQACVIPYRWVDNRLEFCLITSLNSGRWIFPKGIIDPGETPEETGLKEAREEAGLRGRIVGEPLGAYQDSKWGGTVQISVLLMEVTQCDARWDEDQVRQRRWAEPSEALNLLTKAELERFAEEAAQRISCGPN